jgi:hypothetical protein
LTGFFKYYSTFYYEFIICPYFGTELCRASFAARALVDWDLRLTGVYPKAAEHFKVVYFLFSKSIEICRFNKNLFRGNWGKIAPSCC